jgi:hypothetical protein
MTLTTKAQSIWCVGVKVQASLHRFDRLDYTLILPWLFLFLYLIKLASITADASVKRASNGW